MDYTEPGGYIPLTPEDFVITKPDHWLQLHSGARLIIDHNFNVSFDYSYCESKHGALAIMYRVLCWHLAHMPRFIAATPVFYSVAQHSALCWALGRKVLSEDANSDIWLHILLHDAHEAFMGDFPRPLFECLNEDVKTQLKGLKSLIQKAILNELEISSYPNENDLNLIKTIDDMALKVEREWFFTCAELSVPEWEIDKWELPSPAHEKAVLNLVNKRPPENSDFAKLLHKALQRKSPYADTRG